MLDPLFAGPSFQMWATLAIIVVALVAYAMERLSMELVSIGVVCALLLLFSIFPITDPSGANRLPPSLILQGFANPALITVMALLVMGQGMVRTGAIGRAAEWLLARIGKWHMAAVGGLLTTALVVSGFINNTPVVVIFIPVVQIMAERAGISVSKVMIPLSYAAILGGMTTLIGSSTNLLVSGMLVGMGQKGLDFFDFTVPGALMAAVGFGYVLVIAPRLIRDRASLVQTFMEGGGRQFIAQFRVSEDSVLVGKSAPGGFFPDLPNVTVRMVQRGEDAILPPFEDLVLRVGDVLVVAATRKAFVEALDKDQGLQHRGDDTTEVEDVVGGRPWQEGEVMVAEAMVTPASRFLGRNLDQIAFHHQTHCVVLGIQRRSRMIRQRMSDIRFQAGDVLLIQGRRESIDGLKGNPDVVLMEWSIEELPAMDHAKRASLIFLAVVAVAASGVLPIVVAALTGAVAMVATGVLNIRQALRSMDSRIFTAIGAALAMGVALQVSGASSFLAGSVVSLVEGYGTTVALSAIFVLVAVFTNLISNNACAVLFTPIAVDVALQLGVAPQAFAVAVVFAANCSFASPLGYQTNLLVMGPGHHRFIDFTIVGTPLVFVLWGAFTLIGPWYFGL